jgi:hypothetical protein
MLIEEDMWALTCSCLSHGEPRFRWAVRESSTGPPRVLREEYTGPDVLSTILYQ